MLKSRKNSSNKNLSLRFVFFNCAALMTTTGFSQSVSQPPSSPIESRTFTHLKQLGMETALDLQTDLSFLDTTNDAVLTKDGGQIIVGGTTNMMISGEITSGGRDGFILKIKPNGKIAWIQQMNRSLVSEIGLLNGTGGDQFASDGFKAVDSDNAGNLYIGGWTRGGLAESHAGLFDMVAYKFNAQGQIIWARQFGAEAEADLQLQYPGADLGNDQEILDVAFDEISGDMFFSATTRTSITDTIAGNKDMVLARLNGQTGETVWIKHYGVATLASFVNVPGANAAGGGGNNFEIPQRLAIHPSGDLIIAGDTSSNLADAQANPALFRFDIFMLRVDPVSAAPVFALQLGANASALGIPNTAETDLLAGLVVDQHSMTLAIGTTGEFAGSGTGQSDDIALAQFDYNGRLNWALQLDNTNVPGNASSSDAFYNSNSLAKLDNGDFVFCGGTFGNLADSNIGSGGDVVIGKVDANGNLIDLKQWGVQASADPNHPAQSTARADNCRSIQAQGSSIWIAGDTVSNLAETHASPTQDGTDIFYAKIKSDLNF